jgi:hypothetical protein
MMYSRAELTVSHFVGCHIDEGFLLPLCFFGLQPALHLHTFGPLEQISCAHKGGMSRAREAMGSTYAL